MSTTETTHDRAASSCRRAHIGPVDPAQGGPAARPGPGRLLRRRQAARHGLRPLRPLAVRAREDRLDRRLGGARARRRLRDADGRRGRDPDRPVLRDVGRRRARTSRTTRSPSARCATWASRSPRSCAATRELARDAAELVEVEYEPLDVLVDAREAVKNATVLHEEAGSNVVWSGVFDWGDWEAAKAEADQVVRIDELHFDRFSSTPLECSGALVEYERGTGQWTLHCNHQMPGIGAIWMAPALRDRDRQAPLRHPATSAAASATRSASTRYYVALLPARAQAEPAGPVDGVAHRPAHGERARQRALVPRRRGGGQGRRDDARLQGARRSTTAAPSRATSRSAASSGRRSRRAATAGGTSASTSRRWRRTSRRCRRTAATRACSTCG